MNRIYTSISPNNFCTLRRKHLVASIVFNIKLNRSANVRETTFRRNIFRYASILCANDFYYKTNFPCILTGVSQGLASQASFSCATDFRSRLHPRRQIRGAVPSWNWWNESCPRYRHCYGINQKTKEIDGWTKSINFKRAPLPSVKSFFESSYILTLHCHSKRK